jgi:hypothetical protein
LIQRFSIADYYPAPEGSQQWQPINGGSTWYDLRAVLNHHGSTPNGGHYTASICYDIETGDWVEIDDIPPSAKYVPKITKKTGEGVVTVSERGKLPPTSKNALILYYVRELLPEEVAPRWASGFVEEPPASSSSPSGGSPPRPSAPSLPASPPQESPALPVVEPYPEVNANDFDAPEFDELSPDLQSIYGTDEAFTTKYNMLIKQKIPHVEVKRVFLMNGNQLIRKIKELYPRAQSAVETLIEENNISKIVDSIFKKMSKDVSKVTRRRQRMGRKHTRKLRR